jgi:hypothetical protein
MTKREQIEREMGVFGSIKIARVGRRYPAAPGWAPSHWPKTLKVWSIVVLVYVCLSFIGGVAVGVIGRVWP